jgi:hypothetical protein
MARANRHYSKSFIEEVKQSLGFKAKGKSITGSKDHYQLKDMPSPTRLQESL